MGGELWDDSALAFDDAISKYKIMYGEGGNDGSLNGEGITKGTKYSAPLFDESDEDEIVYAETNDHKTDNPVQDTNNTYFNAKTTEDYKLLLNQYNDIEEKRQQLLAQLYQYGNWDYQGYDFGPYNSQYYPAPTPQAPGPTICSCRSYVCPYSTGETCVGNTGLAQNGSSVSLEDGGFMKAAMGAVDKAFSSFNVEDKGSQATKSTLGFDWSDCGSEERGSRAARYQRTAESDLFYAQELISISAMPVYEAKSHEELRWEDYRLTGIEGKEGKELETGLINGSSVSLEDGGFIKAAMGAVDKAVSSFNAEDKGSQATRSTFGFDLADRGGEERGSTVAHYQRTSESDSFYAQELVSISAIPFYEAKSHEELRWEDYRLTGKEGNKGKEVETGLSVVLKAWFSAGFYTGKYLSEQSSANN